jgi:OOP family OmpA-OmpF porin
MDNRKNQFASFCREKNRVKVAIWRQKQRVRLYVNESKVWDLPRAFADGVNYNALVFGRQDAKEGNRFFLSNLRLAVGAPDTRNKLLSEGKFSTTGIYFQPGSAVVRPESCGILNQIATVLKENPALSVQIVGHTDSDGPDDLNLQLSRDRGQSVKEMLVKEFGIAAERLDFDGKGETEPVGDNSKAEGKAANRRVEFLKRG